MPWLLDMDFHNLFFKSYRRMSACQKSIGIDMSHISTLPPSFCRIRGLGRCNLARTLSLRHNVTYSHDSVYI